VVVKIQRPRARAQATADLDIVRRLARLLDRRADWARHLGVLALADGFAQALDEELDYRIELANMRAVADASGDVRIPTPYPEWSGRHVLVMQRLPGRPLSDARDVLTVLSDDQRAEMAQHLLTAVLRQVMVSGVFHADLHPGNIFIDSDGTVALLDFGSVGRLDQTARTCLSTLLLAFDRQDAIAAADALMDLLGAPTGVDDRAFEQQLGQLIVRYAGGLGTGGSAALYLALFKLVLTHRLSVPAPVAAAFRALGAVEGSLPRLTGVIDLATAAREDGRSLMAELMGPQRIRSTLEMQLVTVLPLLQRLPRRLNRLTEELESGQFTINVRAFGHAADRSFVTGIVQQVVVAMLAAALAIGGIILVVADTGPIMTPGLRLYTFLGLILLLFAFVLGSRAMVLVFRQAAGGRNQRNRR
jgi:ubiquinone biosynthesis protein